MTEAPPMNLKFAPAACELSPGSGYLIERRQC
jgi:hypothetical protein